MLSEEMPDKLKEIIQSTWPQIFMKPLKQPDWVCHDCGTKYGNWYSLTGEYTGPKSHCATYHESLCNVCGQVKAVTEARDYGYLRAAWLDERR
jgi:hypothetical protein